VGLSTVSAIFGNSATAGAAMAALGIGSQVGIVLPFSRTQESEADQLGQQLMAKAGFDPAQALTLWQKMGQLGGSGTPAILSDHPSDEDRLQALTKTLPKAEQMFDPAHPANCQR
jgi:predicted Zn-dependent protease